MKLYFGCFCPKSLEYSLAFEAMTVKIIFVMGSNGPQTIFDVEVMKLNFCSFVENRKTKSLVLREKF